MLDVNRKGDWMQTASGRAFWPIDPHPDDIDIEDIAHALSNQCRFAGHVKEFYSVAQHSVLVARHVPEDQKLWALLHDAPEAYLTDIHRPLKPFLKEYAEFENAVLNCIIERFGLSKGMPRAVDTVDKAICMDEFAQLMRKPAFPLPVDVAPLGIEIEPWSPHFAKRIFLEDFALYSRGVARAKFE